MFPLVFAAVLGPTAYELYYLRYATSKNCLQIEIITRKRYATTNRYKQTGSSMYGCNVQQRLSPDIYTRSLDPRITWSQQNERKKKRRRKGRFLEKRGLKREEHIGDMVQGQRPASSYSVCARLSLFFSKKSRPVCYTRTHIQLRMLGDFWISVGRHRKCTLHASD